MECAQVTEEQRLWTETQIQKAKHLAELSRLSLPDNYHGSDRYPSTHQSC